MWENMDQNNSEYGHFLRSEVQNCQKQLPGGAMEKSCSIKVIKIGRNDLELYSKMDSSTGVFP